MSASKKSRAAWTVLLVAWLCFVWGHSLVPADLSSEESSWFVGVARPFFEALGIADEGMMTHLVRKTAHFSEYAVLMAIASGFARAWWEGSALGQRLRLAIWVCVPVVDEFIQSFTPGRDPRVTDVLIDMSGGLLGMLIWWLSHRAPRRRQT